MYKHYLTCFEITPYGGKSFRINIVSSENPFEIIKRSKKEDPSTEYIIIFKEEIDGREYNTYKHLNPTNDGCYLCLKKVDYSKFIEEEK